MDTLWVELTGTRKVDPKSALLTVNQIEKVLTEHFLMSIGQMGSKCRKRGLCYARHVSMYFLTKYSKMTMEAIGLRFGGRDHTTVIHAKKLIQDLMDTDDEIFIEIQSINEKILVMAKFSIDSTESLIANYRRTVEILGKMRRHQKNWENGYSVEDKKKKIFWEDAADDYLAEIEKQPEINIPKY